MTAPTPCVIAALLGPPGPQIGCDQCFAQLDVYVDEQVEGRDADESTPGMRTHLAGCPACQEEYESLSALLRMPVADDAPDA
jgi:hypothetical protein